MKLSKAFGSLFLLASLVFVSPASAGGGPVEFNVEPNSSLNPGEQYIVHARVYDGSYTTPCKNCYIKLGFKNPQDGDYIAQDSEVTNDEGRIYAKVISKVSGERIIIVKELKNSSGKKIGDGSDIGSSVALKYTGESIFVKTPTNLRITQIETTNDPNVRKVHIMWDPIEGATSYVIYKPMGGINFYHTTVDTNLYEMDINTKSTFYIAVSARKEGMESARSQILTIDLAKDQPSDNPTPPPANINAYLLSQQFVGQNNRQVTVKWGAFDGYPGTFKIYVKSATNKNGWEQTFDGSKGPSATFSLKADQDYHLKVHGCMDKFGTCVDSNILTLPKLQKQDRKVVIPENPNPTISHAPTEDSKDVEQLNKKVENLQNQLDQSKKSQSVLEQRVNDLVSFIKRIFPFFK